MGHLTNNSPSPKSVKGNSTYPLVCSMIARRRHCKENKHTEADLARFRNNSSDDRLCTEQPKVRMVALEPPSPADGYAHLHLHPHHYLSRSLSLPLPIICFAYCAATECVSEICLAYAMAFHVVQYLDLRCSRLPCCAVTVFTMKSSSLLYNSCIYDAAAFRDIQ